MTEVKLSEVEEALLRQEWRTPAAFLEALAREFTIDLDVAASAENAVVPAYLDQAADGLAQPWFGGLCRVAWCNPGFRDLQAWVGKAVREVHAVPGCTALVMATAAPSTRWWAFALAWGAEIRLLAPRPQFEPPPGIRKSSNARENALLIFRGLYGQAASVRAAGAHIWTWRWQGADLPPNGVAREDEDTERT